MIATSDITLSTEMQRRISEGAAQEDMVRTATCEAFNLLLHPILMHYNRLDIEKMKQLLEGGLVDVNALAKMPLKHPHTPDDELHSGLVHLAVLKLKPEMIPILCHNGANPNLPNSDGKTPLHNICYDDLERSYPYHKRISYARGGDSLNVEESMLIKLLNALIDCGADPQVVDYNTNISAMHEALALKGYSVCEAYLKRGANFLDERSGVSPYKAIREINSSQVHAATYEHIPMPQQDALSDMQRTIENNWKFFNKKRDGAITTKEQALMASSVGKLRHAFASDIWQGNEKAALDLIFSLPPFAFEALHKERAHFTLKVHGQSDLLEPLLPWTKRIESPSTPPSGKKGRN